MIDNLNSQTTVLINSNRYNTPSISHEEGHFPFSLGLVIIEIKVKLHIKVIRSSMKKSTCTKSIIGLDISKIKVNSIFLKVTRQRKVHAWKYPVCSKEIETAGKGIGELQNLWRGLHTALLVIITLKQKFP